MGALIDLTGRTYGLLTVVKRLGNRTTARGARQPVWGCQCRCGRRTIVEGRALRAGRAMTCRECVRDPARHLKYGHTYLVYWPILGILKIGRTTRGERLEMMRQTGGWVIFDAQDTDDSWERVGMAALAELFDPAFTGPSQAGVHRADRILCKGRGWSECFLVEEEDLQLAYDVCFRAFMREGNDFGQNPPATPAWRRALTGILRARAADRRGRDRARVADDGGVGVAVSAAGARGSGAGVSGVAFRHSGGEPRRARACDGGSRSRVDLGRRDRPADRVSIARRPATAGGRYAAPADHQPLPFSTARARERGNACASARESTSMRGSGGTGPSGTLGTVGRRVRTPAAGETFAPCPPRCSSAGVSKPSAWVYDSVRSLRHGDGAPAGVLGNREVHRAVGDLRRVAGRGVRR